MDKKTLAKMIDHTLLRPDASSKDIEEFCKEALEYNFMSVCVQPYFVPLVYKLLKDSEIKICTVIDFPHGSNSPSAKAFQIEELLKKGAEEFDIVVNISAIKDRNEKVLREEIKKAVETASGKIVKIIIETCYLTDDEKIYITNIIKEEGAHFVKTSTGFGPKGAEIQDIILLKKIAENKLKIKASGGIRTLEQALSFINAGADRLGTSQSIKILKELNE
ncbi:MAG: deoxyribose-phosphate aldolase [Dictyoglomaceae bacterium]